MKTPISTHPELRLLPAILSVVLVGTGAALGAFFSWPMLALFFGTAPVGLTLLWMTRDVPAPEDRIAAVDLERARQRQAPEPRAMARAA
jgi:hypothetical protein